MDPRTRRLLEGPIVPTLLRLAAPNVVVMVMQASIGLIETYFLARLGLDALAGVALVFPVLMLFQMISAGAMGGGILSAIARALGRGDKDAANVLVWHAVALAVGLGVATMAVTLLFGPALYAAMGGRDGSLAAATLYSHLIFSGAVLIWLFNSFAAVIRGTGNMAVPAWVTAIGAIVLIPLSPVLIFGLGPFPKLGIAGGATAVLLYYFVGSAVFIVYIWSGRGVLKPSFRPARLQWTPLREILRVGAVSSVVSVSTNVSIGVTTGLAGLLGPAAVAGYGTGARLEYLLVPLVFGLGAPVGAMVGTAIGAGQVERALRAAWTGALIAGIITEAIGLAAALFPHAWLALFGADATMLTVGTQYLQIVGPFYGFFGAGLALYFASQGAGRLGWPATAAILRIVIAAGGGFLAIRMGLGIVGLFAAVGIALAIFGVINAAAIVLGAWFKRERVAAVPQPS
ncbi:MATE family efflux transporter [Pseudolabrys taiwanensis]|uniref:MATE family efflux transporter n=1 Tax=Pseudolabrys taiwanensis TaxID=331696 RepID=A0A345ZY64_9HYPH|nr:MATE family efflux transporter [Pseudolabrys taiwanensis]AXK81861.1 MATE family efflux transporter [Pseudolabrys taiwanensis]